MKTLRRRVNKSALELDLSDGPARVFSYPLPESKRIAVCVETPSSDGTIAQGQGVNLTLDAREALKLSQFLFGAACDAMGLDLALEVAKR